MKLKETIAANRIAASPVDAAAVALLRKPNFLCRFFFLTVFGALPFVFASPCSHAVADEPSSEPATVSRAELLMELVDLVLEKHVTPLTRQEMVRQIVSATLSDDPLLVAEENAWARRISAASDRETLLKLLSERVTGNFLLDPSDNESLRKVATELQNSWPELGYLGVQVAAGPDQKVNEQLSANRYVGIGISLTIAGRFPVLGGAIANGPADHAGMKGGDRILAVDGKSTIDLPLTEVIDMLRGPEGSITHVRWETPSSGKITEAELTRGVVAIASLAKPVYSKSGKTILISINQLSASTVHELRKIEETLSAEVELVVIDFKSMMRADDLHLGVLLGDALLDQQPLGSVLITGQPPREIHTDAGRLFAGQKLVIKIHQPTSGVFKWIAHALQASKSAVVVGQPTISPALISEQFEISSGRIGVQLPTGVLIGVGGKALNPNGNDWQINSLAYYAMPAGESQQPQPQQLGAPYLQPPDAARQLPGQIIPDLILSWSNFDAIEKELLDMKHPSDQE